MKNWILFIVIALLASCAPRQKLIVGSWKFKDMKIESNLDSANLAFVSMAGNQMKTNISIKMEADSTYTIMQLKEQRAIRGKWWFSADKKNLFTNTDLGLNKYKVLKLTKNELVYEVLDNNGHLFKMMFTAITTAGSK
jgi:hypothetical protein